MHLRKVSVLRTKVLIQQPWLILSAIGWSRFKVPRCKSSYSVAPVFFCVCVYLLLKWLKDSSWVKLGVYDYYKWAAPQICLNETRCHLLNPLRSRRTTGTDEPAEMTDHWIRLKQKRPSKWIFLPCIYHHVSDTVKPNLHNYSCEIAG